MRDVQRQETRDVSRQMNKGGQISKESLVLRLWGVLEDHLRVLSTAIITIRSDEGLTLKSNLPTQLIKQIILY